jgi:predicted transcriptional regulator
MDDVRYIILPGDIRKEPRLQLSHLRVAMVLGAYSKRHGWTDLSQNDIGEMADISRETVNRCVADLVEWGWVDRRKKKGKNQYVYRFIMDREDNCDLQLTCDPQLTKHCEPPVTGTVISEVTDSKESLQLDSKSTSGAGARASDASASRAPRAVKSQPALTITHLDASWDDWLKSVDEETALRMEAAGEFEATARWPSVEGARIVRLAGKNITNRIIGENGA